ncbi:MAG TPA: hypothetical protein VIL49_07805 [Capillimicrobium sp.]|jgi:uncharacterized membrane protein YgcG
MRRAALVLLLALLLLAPAGALAQQDLIIDPAQGTTTPTDPGQGLPTDPGAAPAIDVDAIATSLRTDPVYDDEDLLDAGAESRLEDTIAREAGGPLYVVALPADTPASHSDVGEALFERVGPGVYAIVIGDQFRAGETEGAGLDRGAAGEIATSAKNAADGPEATLTRFVTDVGEARANGGAPSSESVSSTGALGLLAVLLLGGGAVLFFRRRRMRHEERQQIEGVRALADEDLIALGDDIRKLDLDIEMPGVDPRAKEDYGRALEAHSSANVALRTAKTPEDFEPIGHTLEEGRYAMESAKARLEGREPPEHRPPCFFDPRHGPSTRDVEWAPEWGEARAVPACEADAIRIEEGRDPHAREIEVAGYGRTPYWNAPGYYGPYAGGFFGGFGGTGLLTGMLAGSLLTSMWAAPMAYGGGFGDAGYGGDVGGGGDWGGGGDFGGGFGGGDFGGGGDF